MAAFSQLSRGLVEFGSGAACGDPKGRSLTRSTQIPCLRRSLHANHVVSFRKSYHGSTIFKRVEQKVSKRAVQCVMEPPSKEMAGSMWLSEVSAPEQFEQVVAGNKWRVVPDLWDRLADEHGDLIALLDPHRKPVTKLSYKELHGAILNFSEGLKLAGIGPGDRVSLFSDNSARWLVADQGIMMVGACNAVRGAKAPAEELVYILKHSESTALVVESYELLDKLLPSLGENASSIKLAIVLWGESEGKSYNTPFPVHQYLDFVAQGQASRGNARRQSPARPNDLATIVYTSGTTGFPKGVMLTHANLMHQIRNFRSVIDVHAGDSLLSLLPPWHMYERSAEYYCLSSGVRQVYSNVKNFKEDLQKYPPDYFVAVPLVYDVLYNGVQKKLAAATPLRKKLAFSFLALSKRFMEAKRIWEGMALPTPGESPNQIVAMGQWLIAGLTTLLLYPLHLLANRLVYSKVKEALGIKKVAISGGGSLAPHVDKFFEAIGITLLNGYGLTETAPVLCCRRPDKNVLGSIGTPLPETQMKVVDMETGETVPPGTKGKVLAKGPQVMKGYLKNPTSTAKVLKDGGWFDTEDLGWIVPRTSLPGSRRAAGVLVLEGRSKDTIVLASGENIEPAPLEEAILQSEFISQVMLVGHEKRKVGALVLLSKDDAKAAALAARKSSNSATASSAEPSEEELRLLVRKELTQRMAKFHPHERVGPFVMLEEAFTVENGELTATMKMKRDVIAQKYQDKVDIMYKRTE